MKILLVEDEPELSASIMSYLQKEGYLVEAAENFTKASQKIYDYEYDCVLLDITLPGGSGLDVLQHLKSNKSKTGVIIISARDSLDDRIKGLDLGADDYLTKPFYLSELNARIKALIRRKNFEGNKTIVINEISITPDDRSVKVNNEPVLLTAKEYDLLLYFISNRNRVVSKNSIAEHFWGDSADQKDSHDFVYVHLRNLRKKLSDKGCTDYIQTIYGIGYNFKVS